VRRAAILRLAFLVAMAVGLIGAAAAAGGRVRLADDLKVNEKGRVSFSGSVHPDGRATTAYFEFGLGSRYREPRPAGIVYDMRTPVLHLKPAYRVYSVSGVASGLVPNALYNVRLVAKSAAGTVFGPNATFTTAKDPPPPRARMGTTMNLAPASGLVLIRPSPLGTSRARAARLVEGAGFSPLTEPRQLAIDSQIDARAGALRLVVAAPEARHVQLATLSGGLFRPAQTRSGLIPGLTTLTLLEGDFPGAPTAAGCPSPGFGTPSSTVLQTLRVRDQRGAFRTVGRDSSATADTAGTVWETIDRCDGTMTIVDQGEVTVTDEALGTTMTLGPGQRYLAQAP
jgi:hypothetical protein